MTRPTILIADDNAPLLKALTLRLEREGFNVIGSQDAYQALELSRRHSPDVLVLDVNMPAGDGFSVQERIAKCPTLARTPVIYLTGDKSSAVDHKAQSMGAIAVIHKPFRLGDLVDVIRAAISRGTDQMPRDAAAA